MARVAAWRLRPSDANAGAFAEWLRAELDQRHITQAQAAQEVGVSKSAMNDWAAGRRLPGADYLRAVARWAAPQEPNGARDRAVEALYLRLLGLVGYTPPSSDAYVPDKLRRHQRFNRLLTELDSIPDEMLDLALYAVLSVAQAFSRATQPNSKRLQEPIAGAIRNRRKREADHP